MRDGDLLAQPRVLTLTEKEVLVELERILEERAPKRGRARQGGEPTRYPGEEAVDCPVRFVKVVPGLVAALRESNVGWWFANVYRVRLAEFE